MSVYIPEFESQTDQNAPLPWTNCNPASQAMLLDQWSYGRIDTSDIALRAASGVPVASGTTFKQMAQAIRSLFQLDLRYSEAFTPSPAPITWRDLRDHLADDGGAVVCGFYQSLRGETNIEGQQLTRWQPQGEFGHAMFACDLRPNDTVLLMDPLGKNRYDGDRIRIRSLFKFIWRNGDAGNARVTAAYTFKQDRPPKGETLAEKIARLTKEVSELRQQKPIAWERWVNLTHLTVAKDGLPLRTLDRLRATKLYLTEVD